MGIIGKWLFCVKCQYFYPNKAVLESHEVCKNILSSRPSCLEFLKLIFVQSEDHDEVAKVIVVENMVITFFN